TSLCAGYASLSPSLAPAPRAAKRPPRRRAWLRILVVQCGLPCDPPVGGHSCNGGTIPRFHRAVCDLYGAIDVKAGVSSILFDLTATISSSRPIFLGRCAQRPSRVAEGHRETTCP